jgi:hypothetical protein
LIQKPESRSSKFGKTDSEMLHAIYLSVDDQAEFEIGRRSSSQFLNSKFQILNSIFLVSSF